MLIQADLHGSTGTKALTLPWWNVYGLMALLCKFTSRTYTADKVTMIHCVITMLRTRAALTCRSAAEVIICSLPVAGINFAAYMLEVWPYRCQAGMSQVAQNMSDLQDTV